MLDLESDNEEPSLKINQSYAKKYDEWRNKEELQKRDILKIEVIKVKLNFVFCS